MFDEQIIELLESHVKLQRPFESKLYILVEMSGTSINEMENQFCNLIEHLMDKNLIHNGTYSSELTKMKKLWELRERIAEVLGSNGYCFKYDISIPLKEYYDLVEILRERLKSNKKVTSISGYGHIGDSNLHLSVTCDKFYESVKNEIEPFVYEWVSERNGSVSSEHGLGLKRNNHIHYSKSPEAIDLMKKIKKILDPKLLLNPQKMMNFK
ncbi:hypothetical protein RND71_044227 [Anisodus tanguticus]|uniref:FAD-binding oxidoreductase/transferase type 4 C-terminal domain-containing protein n=1 Tax=Anisodus tanguticus TaxID=243964 RepID=A0AAE1QNS7_9SOLA|nr:hypothetical protein RND71_044227 [Anisodus tanguticus]